MASQIKIFGKGFVVGPKFLAKTIAFELAHNLSILLRTGPESTGGRGSFEKVKAEDEAAFLALKEGTINTISRAFSATNLRKTVFAAGARGERATEDRARFSERQRVSSAQKKRNREAVELFIDKIFQRD